LVVRERHSFINNQKTNEFKKKKKKKKKKGFYEKKKKKRNQKFKYNFYKNRQDGFFSIKYFLNGCKQENFKNNNTQNLEGF